MIVYQNSKSGFLHDAFGTDIPDKAPEHYVRSRLTCGSGTAHSPLKVAEPAGLLGVEPDPDGN